MASTPEQDFIKIAQDLGPIIRKYSDQGEREGRMPQEMWDALSGAGLLSLLVPKKLGGSEVDPITYARVVEEISSHDAAAGWTLTNPLLFGFLCSRLPQQGALDILGQDPRARLAATFGPLLKAVPADGGYRISGYGTFASNCHQAVWMGAVCQVVEDSAPQEIALADRAPTDRAPTDRAPADSAPTDNAPTDNAPTDKKPPRLLWAYYPAKDCRILDNWHVMGMRGSGSNDIEVAESFVPHHRCINFGAEYQLGPDFQGPLYRFPFIGMAAGGLTPVVLGIARRAIDEAAALAKTKTPAGSSTLLWEHPNTQLKLAQAEGAVRSGRALLYETLNARWEATLAGEAVTLNHRAGLLLAASTAASNAAHAVELMFGLGGTTGIYDQSALQRCLRDMQVLRQQRLLAEGRYETFGQMYFGLDPDFPTVLL